MRKGSTLIMEKTPLIGRSLEKELFINATPQRVFQALTEQADLECWFVKTAEVDLRLGGDQAGKITTLDSTFLVASQYKRRCPRTFLPGY
jgi:uncharacterized protein YndB with AHSA1/START domain